jgi:hypothetical protein
MSALINPGTAVRSVDNPGREGVVTNAPPRKKNSGLYVQVRWSDGATDFVHEDEVEPLNNLDLQDPFDLVRRGKYGRAVDLRRNLTYVHLSGKLANLVYAMGVTNTEFYPHQYRPLLTLLDSPVNGLLIADEVGLGKTIEAGLIWTELRARFDMRRLLVVCPAVLREKWREELRNRFGVDAQIINAADLLDALKQPRQRLGEGKAWITSYQAARPPKNWRPAARTPPKRPSSRWILADYLRDNDEEEPLLDMVVFDEAHYMRNHETAAWRLGDLLRDVSVYQLMLSATPINLHNQDLYNLLNLIDPDHFASEQDFNRLLEANRPLVAARDAVLNRRASAEEILFHLREASENPLLAEFTQLNAVLQDAPTDEKLSKKGYRAELADIFERMNLLSHVVTRTRKRDVDQSRVKRDVRREAIEMSPAERALYIAVTEATRKFAWSRGISDGFLLASPQRQVTSCPAATAAAWMTGGRAIEELAEDLDEEYEDELEDDDAPFSFTPALRLFSGRVLDAENANETGFVENHVDAAVRYFHTEYGCRVFNLSYGDLRKPYSGRHVRGLAVTLDTLTRELGVLFVVPTGNFSGIAAEPRDWRSQYPDYLLQGAALLDPATALNVLTVGSLARWDATLNAQRYRNDVAEQPIARHDQPSPFTRAGPSVGGAIKPELVAYGGNWAVNVRTVNRWTIRQGLGEVSTCRDFAAGRLLVEDSGTSFAAPHVAHLAARILAEHPQADHNLLRALLVGHARWPEACEKLIADKVQRLRLCGYGRVDDAALDRSTEHDVTLIATDTIPDRCHHFYEIPLPPALLEGHQRTREITVALSHSPVVRTTRVSYKSCDMEFRIVWAEDLAFVTRMFNAATSREDYQRIAEVGNARIGARNRGMGTVQTDTWTLRRVTAQRRAQRLFLVVTRIDEAWGRELTLTAEPYSLAVVLRDRENAEARLYTQIQARLRARVQARVRA